MAERIFVVNKEVISYTGVFEAKELTKLVKRLAKEKSYWRYEKSHTETTKPEGKHAEIVWQLQRKMTDYAKSVINIAIAFKDMKDIMVKRDGKRKKVQEGTVEIAMEGILETDYEDRWETKPVFYFLRVLFEKYVYSPYVSKFEKQVKKDFYHFKNEIKSFLNLGEFAKNE